MEQLNTFAQIILPLAVEGTFTYSIPNDLENTCRIGMRVVVQFGAKKLYTGIVSELHKNKPVDFQAKPIINILDSKPTLNNYQLTFWNWLSSYYMCTIGEIMKAALPSGLKLESENFVYYNENQEETELSEAEQNLLDYIKKKKNISISELSVIFDKRLILKYIQKLNAKQLILISEDLKENYKAKFIDFVSLNKNIENDEALNSIFNELRNAPKQLQIIQTIIQLSDLKEIAKTELLKISGSSVSQLKELEKKGIVEIHKRKIFRTTPTTIETREAFELNEFQNIAFNDIKKAFSQNKIVLLHGITSSGKTEIYIHLIKEQISRGKQVLYMLPEIALTAQIINRLQNVFGEKTGIYHSKYNDPERVEVWHRLINTEDEKSYQIILGVRSSVFLPFSKLGLIIIDEEHETSYKQYDPAPRYNARDSALVLAHYHNANVLLGTATPAIETYFNAKNGKYALVDLNKRHKEIKLPEIKIVNIHELRRKKRMKSIFSPQLLEGIKNSLNNGEQVILFQNRRGYSPYIECSNCLWIPKCKFCDVSLTYHKNHNNLVCHYCGYTINFPQNCPECAHNNIHTKGFGTEKIEEELSIFFPEARIARMDLDTTRTKKSYLKLISQFENYELDILIGTQMISKGLDFAKVSLVGILNADNMLNFPDFRANERSFQLMAQVGGRAGRSDKQGLVIIQCSTPKHPIIQNVMDNNYVEMFYTQMLERQQFKYPPYTRLISITLRHRELDPLNIAAAELALILRKTFGNRILGPEFPLLNRIQNWFQKNILIKIERERSAEKAKNYVKEAIDEFKKSKANIGIRLIINVDPL